MATEQSSGSRNFSGFVRGVMPTVDSTLHALDHHHGHQHGATANDVIIDIPGSTNQDENDNTRGGNQTGGLGNTTASLADLRIAGTWAEKIIPFVIVVLLKITFDHRLGLIVLIGMFGTYLHFNGTLKRQVALKEKRSFFTLVLTMTFLPLNILFIYYVFTEHQLQNCLVFMKPSFDEIDVWTLLWIVGITDFIIKFATIAAKCSITILPRSWLGYKVRGKYYLFIEQCSQFYRLLPPVPVWCSYLSDDTYSYWIFTYCLAFIYLIAKARTVYDRTVDLRRAWKNLFSDVQYGDMPNKEEMLAAGSACPICQEDYADPIMLHSCKHIFCEECVSIWFDRERTCPMCRAKIADDPSWKDGSTAAYLQFF